MIRLLFWLLSAHFLGDFVFQSDTMAREKCSTSESPLQKFVPWYWWLTAHAFVQASLIVIVTGSVSLGILEGILHFGIDFGKTHGWYGIAVDQTLHILCKIFYFSIITAFTGIYYR